MIIPLPCEAISGGNNAQPGQGPGKKGVEDIKIGLLRDAPSRPGSRDAVDCLAQLDCPPQRLRCRYLVRGR